MSGNPNRRRFYTEKQIAEMTAVSLRTVLRWVKSGELASHRLGRSIRISEADLLAFLAVRRTTA
jgi:excisionase family DNA binding protein